MLTRVSVRYTQPKISEMSERPLNVSQNLLVLRRRIVLNQPIPKFDYIMLINHHLHLRFYICCSAMTFLNVDKHITIIKTFKLNSINSVRNENEIDRNRRIDKEIKIWNEAIEAAIKVAQRERHNIEMVDEIRKLKK